MTVKELITLLLNFNMDFEVCTSEFCEPNMVVEDVNQFEGDDGVVRIIA